MIDVASQVTLELHSDRVALSLVKIDDGVMTILAQSSMNDTETPTSASLIYRGRVEKEVEFQLIVTTMTEEAYDTIMPTRL